MFTAHTRAVGVLLAVALGVSPAILETSAVAETSARQCVAHPALATGPAPAMQCYSTFAAAIAAASDGAVRLPESTPVGPLPTWAINANRLAATTSANPLTSVILSIDYTGTNESGSGLVWSEPSGCGTYSSSSMPTGWNDVVSSVSTFNGCGTTLYQNTNFGGSTSSVGVDATVNSLGSFNREASSQKWCTSSTC